MKRYLALCMCAFALLACGEKPVETDELKCGDLDVFVTVYKNRADAVVGGLESKLTRIMTISGPRYNGRIGDKDLVLWNKDSGEWIMVIGESEAIECVKKKFDSDLGTGRSFNPQE